MEVAGALWRGTTGCGGSAAFKAKWAWGEPAWPEFGEKRRALLQALGLKGILVVGQQCPDFSFWKLRQPAQPVLPLVQFSQCHLVADKTRLGTPRECAMGPVTH